MNDEPKKINDGSLSCIGRGEESKTPIPMHEPKKSKASGEVKAEERKQSNGTFEDIYIHTREYKVRRELATRESTK
ncbi:hypothetical protein HS088_TW18G00352 [Tripterygium wilfordii]|uniref:Uncharacterized protein n=1 Tax=Tripterygium wilfordii TaxID=458696 RepID=A0A7J7CBZ8_TRIWF|nr:hypothetical protein HS088_TW18G00352 [Tripterygium wilfordii]